MSDSVRLDKWLWAARFFKTRTLATEAVDGGRVRVNGASVKPARDVKAGDRIELNMSQTRWELIVQAVAEKRGPATVARTLYEETAASQQARAAQAEARRVQKEPADDIRGRPTKRDRRTLEQLRRT